MTSSSPTPTGSTQIMRPIVIMGVSGSGKSVVGERLAAILGYPFVEGDKLHPAANVAKMSKGIPLTDDDRWPWLDEVGRRLADGKDAGIIVSCSALRKTYRDRLRAIAGNPVFVFLKGSHAVLQARMEARKNHFMPASLLDSQLATLETPDGEGDVITIDVDRPVKSIVEEALDSLRACAGQGNR